MRSGIQATAMLDRDPPMALVEWINWDSGFRGSGLEVGDQIVAINGQPIPRPADMQETQRLVRSLIGQPGEEQVWAAQGLAEGATITLSVRRRQFPGEGWQTFDVTGTLREEQFYRDAQDRPALAPGGPARLERDGFDDAWLSWYERRLFDWTRVLGGRWWQRRPDTRRALAGHLEDAARVQALVERYPGPFAESVREDWEKARARLEGPAYDIPATALAFRQAQEERARVVAASAREAWNAALAARASETVPAFPCVDPVRGDRSQVAGKVVVLPPIGPSQWIMDMGKPYLTSREGSCCYVAAVEGPALRRLFLAAERYKRHVTPALREDVALIGRVLPDPRLIATGGGALAAFELEPVAALMGDALFADLAAPAGTESETPFAGEDALQKFGATLPPDDAPPRAVLEALVAALKAGDQAVWDQLFADWRIVPDPERPLYYPYYPYHPSLRDEDWIKLRRLILDTVYAIHVVWVDTPRVVLRGDEFPGAPRIEEVAAELDHVGRFGEEYRAFVSTSVQPLWVLQRRDGVAWRIART